MAYKAIIFDIDGTAVPLGAMMPSKTVRSAIAKAQKTIKLAAATGRSYGYAQPIFQNLALDNPSVVMGGSAILDATNQRVLWSKAMSNAQATAALRLLQNYQATIDVSTDPLRNNQPLQAADTTGPVYTIWATDMTPLAAAQLIRDIKDIPDITAHVTPSWIKGLAEVHITHELATKEHAITALLKLLDVRPSEAIGVGDSENDIPLFRSVGYRIAMGNASSALTAIADEIAPSLDEDGLAYVIKTYALNSTTSSSK